MDLATETLKKFGLTDNEAAVYLEIVKKEELTPFQIAQATKIPRTTIYDVLLGLSLKGLIDLDQSDGFTKQKTLVRAKDPSILREILNNRRKDLFALELDVLEVLPDLKKDYHKQKASADFQFYPGVEGARKVYYDDFWKDKVTPAIEWDLLMPMDSFGRKQINEDINKQFEILSKKKHADKTIIPLTDWTKHVLSYQVSRDPRYLTSYDIRYIDEPSFDVHIQFQVQGDYSKIACSKKGEAWGLRIKSKMLAATLKSIFDQNWKIATPVTPELVKKWGPNGLFEAEVRKSGKKNRVTKM
jgi:hypothetical protein